MGSHKKNDKRAYLNAELVKMKGKHQGERTDLTSGQNVQKSVYNEVAKETGVSSKTVQRDVAYVDELVKMKSKPQLKDEDGKFKPFTQNESTDVYKEVAKETGVSKATVQRDVAYVDELFNNHFKPC